MRDFWNFQTQAELSKVSKVYLIISKSKRRYIYTLWKKLKPEGICTNLESIKDYLENFVGFVFGNCFFYRRK